ncbi:MAG TPA: hypothetical protein VFJ58_21340 [Armatimonadota bacterium]|nr:hypothetical protein [Armatimonadota bacterium]
MLYRILLTLAALSALGLVKPAPAPASGVKLAIKGTHFTLNDKPTFLQGISYFAGLGAPEAFIKKDLSDMRRLGFNWIRVFATWNAYGVDLSAVTKDGGPRAPYLERLKWLVAECDQRGIIVDVTLSRESGSAPTAHLGTPTALQRAAETVIAALRDHHNWYVNLANERNIGDSRFVSFDELQTIREAVRRADPALLATASNGGDISKDDLVKYLKVADLDFICPHRPRDPGSPAQTLSMTRQYLEWMKQIGRMAPILYQEPLRRGYNNWNPTCADLITDATGAFKGGAAGWLLHNGGTRSAPDERPRRSFGMRRRRLFDQLDSEERCAAENLRKKLVEAAPTGLQQK